MNNDNFFFFFFRFFPFPFLFSETLGSEGVPAGQGGFQASRDREGFPTPTSNAMAGNWKDWKRRRQGGLSSCNGHRRELTGCCGPRRVCGGRQGSSCCRGRREGLDCGACRLRTLKRSRFDVFFLKKKSIEPAGSQGTDLFVRFTAGSNGPTDSVWFLKH